MRSKRSNGGGSFYKICDGQASFSRAIMHAVARFPIGVVSVGLPGGFGET